MFRLLCLLVLALCAPSCIVEPLDLSDRSCPCAPGFACDQPLNRCCPTGELVTEFEGAWATPTAIRWRWRSNISPAIGFSGFTLLIATDRADIANEASLGPTARRFDRTINSELATSELRRTMTPVEATVTDGLVPATTYWARLIARDGLSCPFSTPAVPFSTIAEHVARVVLFEDELGAGVMSPSFRVVPDPVPGRSGNALLWEAPDMMMCRCPADGGTVACTRCSANLKLDFDAMRAPSLGDITPGTFDRTGYRATLELTVRQNSPAGFDFSRVWLVFAGTDGRCDAEDTYRFEPLAVRDAPTDGSDGGFVTQHIEVPLAELVGRDGPLTLDRTRTGICQFNYGSQWVEGTQIYVDDVRIRY